MLLEPSEEQLRILRREQRNFRGFFITASISAFSLGSGFLYYTWKAHQLAAAGLWPRHYARAVNPMALGLAVGVPSGLVAICFFYNWLEAIRDRRRRLEGSAAPRTDG